MDSTLSPPASSLSPRRPWYSNYFCLGLAAALVVYGIILGRHTGAWAGGSDSSGYLNNARLLRAGHIHELQRAVPGLSSKTLPSYTYIPLGFLPVADDHMVPTYPIGISMLMVATSLICGWPLAPHLTMWLHSMAGVVLMFALARAAGLSRRASLIGALLVAACPLYIFMGTQAMSDVPALAWCTAAVLFAWWSRTRAAWALAAGFSVAVAVLVRPSDLLIMLPVAIALAFSCRRWLLLCLGGLPGAIFLALFNRALYGQILTTGYGAVGGIFQLEYAPPALANYARWLPVLLTPGLALAFAIPWAWRREWRRMGFIMTAWVLTFLVFYVFYFHTHEAWWYLRFILPAFPPLIVLMLVVAQKIAARHRVWSHPMVAAGLALAIIGWSSYWSLDLSAFEAGRGEKVYPDSARWARAHLPPNSVILSMQMSGALLYYTNLVFVRWDQFDPPSFAPLKNYCAQTGRPIFALLFPFEREDVLEKRFPGKWTQVGERSPVTFWKLEMPAPQSPR